MLLAAKIEIQEKKPVLLTLRCQSGVFTQAADWFCKTEELYPANLSTYSRKTLV